MVYSNKFVMCVLHDGEVQKELKNGVVKIPFGAEYTLRFRNKNARRAVVKFFIDGENVSGNGYIINANDHVDIKRYSEKDAAFKFVSLKSPDAVEFGKNGPNEDKQKGLIEAHFYLEKETPKVTEIHHHHYPRPYPVPVYPNPWEKKYPYRGPRWDSTDYTSVTCGGSGRTSSMGGSSAGMLRRTMSKSAEPTFSNSTSPVSLAGLVPDAYESAPNDKLLSCDATPLQDGCTVEGMTTGQRFYSTHIDVEETCTVLKVFLQGFEPKVAQPATAPAKKSNKIQDLEKEQEELRVKLLEAENEAMKKKLAELQSV